MLTPHLELISIAIQYSIKVVLFIYENFNLDLSYEKSQ